jgi:hypothetical protein
MSFDAADLAAFVDPSMPGYVLATINGQPVAGLFRAKYAETFGFVGGTQPTLRILGTESVAVGNPVVINAQNYTVASMSPEGQGLQALQLAAA